MQSYIGGSYSGITYASGQTERGAISGFVNPSGNVIDFYFYADNCSQLNPSGHIVPGPPWPSGFYGGGQMAQEPGVTLRIKWEDTRNGSLLYTLSGRISGLDCWGQVITADVRLVKQ